MILCKRCGALYDDDAWETLPLVGYQADEVETLELRNCTCGSTHSKVIEENATQAKASRARQFH